MRKATVEIEVWVLEEEDLAGVTDEARVRGTLQAEAASLAAKVPGSPSVSFGLRAGPRGRSEARATIGGIGLVAGEGLAFHPVFPGGAIRVPASLVPTEAPPVPAEAPEVVPEVAPAPAPKAAKKVTKKAAKKKAAASD